MNSGNLAVSIKSSDISIGNNVTLGIRPEHLTINQQSDVIWEGNVFVIEKLGSGTFLYIEKENAIPIQNIKILKIILQLLFKIFDNTKPLI